MTSPWHQSYRCNLKGCRLSFQVYEVKIWYYPGRRCSLLVPDLQVHESLLFEEHTWLWCCCVLVDRNTNLKSALGSSWICLWLRQRVGLAKSGSLCDGLNQTNKQQKLAIRTGKRGATISKWHLFITHMMCKRSVQGENPSQLHKRKPYRLHLPRKM